MTRRVADMTTAQRDAKRLYDARRRQHGQVRYPLTPEQRARKQAKDRARVLTAEQAEAKTARQLERNAWKAVHRLYVRLLKQRGVL